MKYIFKLTIILLALSCKAQSPVVPIDTYRQDTTLGAYFKDLNNELNPFVGTWKYTNGNTFFTITIAKEEMIYNGKYYEDLLVGEYRYVENGVEKVNTLPLLSSPLITGGDHSISGRKVINPDYYNPPCNECAPNERRVKLYMNDPDRDYLPLDSITLRYLPNESPEKISIIIKGESGGSIPVGVPDEPRFPYGEFVLIKQ